MSTSSERTSMYQHCLEAEKHEFVETNKATIESVKVVIAELEDKILTGTYSNWVPLNCFNFFKQRLPDSHYAKLIRLFTGVPLNHKDILDLSLYTTEGEVNLLLMVLTQSEKKLYLLSEGGNVSTLTRLAYKLIRIMFDLKTRSFEDIFHKLKRKRMKQESGQQDHCSSLLKRNGETHA